MVDRYSGNQGVLVLFEGEAAKRAHQELFALPDALYRPIEMPVTDELIAVAAVPWQELQIVAGWEKILCAALWSSGKPPVGDVLFLLEAAGMSAAELAALQNVKLGNIFSLLLKRERFDLLRRVCTAARVNLEERSEGGIKVHCHLVSDQTERIVASSL